MKLLEGKTAIITGASRGIGRAIAKKFAQEGANVAFTFLSSVEKGKELEKDRKELLGLFPILKDRLKGLAGNLSGGEQQMLAMARALMARPKILLLDEPSLGLAPKMVEVVFSLIQRINQKGITILLVEQNAFKALELADYAYVIESGKIHLEGSGQELLANPLIKSSYLGE